MKRAKAFTITNFILQRAIFFIMLLVLWYVCFPESISAIEETAFWVDAPDMCNILYQWPGDWAEITANYLSQYFIMRYWGAVLLATFPLIILLSADIIIWQLFRCRRLQCLSFLPAIIMATTLLQDIVLTQYVKLTAYAILIAIIIFLITFRRPLYYVQFRSKVLLTITNILPYILTILLGALFITDKVQKHHEQTLKIEHLAAERNWGELYDLTYPIRAELDDNQLSYALLALSQKDELAEKLFQYPVRGPENIFTHSENYRFNSFFCHELGLPNEAVRYAFEEGQYMPAGASFGAMRRMVDWILEKGDDRELAEFYLNLLSHSSCHDSFVATRQILLNQTSIKKEPIKPEFVGSPSFLYEAAIVLEREPNNTRARDYLLCGLLLLGKTEAFYTLFQQLYIQMDNEPIPTHYMEALVMLMKTHPEIDNSYRPSLELEEAYRNFINLSIQGNGGRERAINAYKGTYWAYLLEKGQSNNQENTVEIISSTNLQGSEFGN